MQHKIVSEQGKKGFMEDTHYYKELNNGSIFGGVYDGHKGGKVSKYAAKNLHKNFFEVLKDKKQPQKAFKEAYLKTSNVLKDTFSGSTAVNFYIKNKKIYWANAGDSHLAVIKNSGATKQLSCDHSLKNPKERARMQKGGAVVIFPWSMLGPFGIQPTRALGDEYFTEIGVLHTPSTGVYEIKPADKWLIAYSDGLTDVMDTKELGPFLKKYNNVAKAANALKNEILKNRKGHDNLTFILLKF